VRLFNDITSVETGTMVNCSRDVPDQGIGYTNGVFFGSFRWMPRWCRQIGYSHLFSDSCLRDHAVWVVNACSIIVPTLRAGRPVFDSRQEQGRYFLSLSPRSDRFWSPPSPPWVPGQLCLFTSLTSLSDVKVTKCFRCRTANYLCWRKLPLILAVCFG
jgi:hypothetical protein